MPCDTVVQLGTIPPLRISQHVGMAYVAAFALVWQDHKLLVSKTWYQKYSPKSLLLSWLYCSSKEPKFVSNGYYSTAFLWDGRVAPFWLILSWMDSYCELHWGDNSMFICQCQRLPRVSGNSFTHGKVEHYHVATPQINYTDRNSLSV